jgi:predicted glutamine amidotransferase
MAATNHDCRFWGIVSTAAPGSVMQAQLLTDPNSLKNLSQANPNGWGLGYYHDATSAPVVNRGQAEAYTDPLFDQAVTAAASLNPPIVVAHVRHCSSGLCDIPNPHPFERTINGKSWLMGHNGTIDKSVLLSLIRPDFLAANPPVNGTDQSQWVDSELYFIFMQQTLIDDNYSVKIALGHVIQSLRDRLPATGYPLNFFLTDGTTLWGYRQGNSLYYLYSTYYDNTTNTNIPYSVLASQYTSASQGSWVTMSDGQLVTMSKDAAPVVEDIQNYFSPASTPTLGDVNDDGLVDSTDALIVLSADVGMATSQFCPMNCGDVNGDGLVDSTDALIILSYDVGVTVPFPVGQPGCPSSATQPPGCSPSWIPTNWPASDSFFSLYTSQDKVFARTWDSLYGGRMFLTADDGANWTQISSADSDIDILSIVMLNSNILAGTWNGFYLSTDGGTTWNAVTPTGIPTDTAICSMAMIDTTLFAGTWGDIYKSSDYGNTWAEVNSGIPVSARITSIVASGGAIFTGSVSNGVFKTTNGGTSWTEINSGLTDTHISQLAVLGTRLFAVTLNGVFVSDNNGISWAADSSGLENINCFVAVNNQLFAGTDDNGVYLSVDSGATWTSFSSGLPTNTRVWSLAVSSDGIFAGTSSGVWRIPISTARPEFEQPVKKGYHLWATPPE